MKIDLETRTKRNQDQKTSMMNISMVNVFISLKTAGDDDQFKNELQYVMNSKMKLPCSEFAAWLLPNAC